MRTLTIYSLWLVFSFLGLGNQLSFPWMFVRTQIHWHKTADYLQWKLFLNCHSFLSAVRPLLCVFLTIFISLIGVCNRFKRGSKRIDEAKSKACCYSNSEISSWFESGNQYSPVTSGEQFVSRRLCQTVPYSINVHGLSFLNRGSSLLWLWTQHTKKYKAL